MTTLLSHPGTPPLSNRPRRISSTPLVLEPAEWLTGLDTILLTPGRYTIGSDSDSTIVLNSGGVRPRHCLIVVGPKRTVLKAWDTFTWLNEAPVDESVLKPGDRLAIGPVEFIVRRATADDLIGSLALRSTWAFSRNRELIFIATILLPPILPQPSRRLWKLMLANQLDPLRMNCFRKRWTRTICNWN